MLSLHGGIFLTLKTEGDLLARIERLVPRLMLVFFVLMTALIAWTFLLDVPIAENYRQRVWTVVFPILGLAAALVAWRQIRGSRFLAAFLASATMIASLLGAVAAGVYPVLLQSSTDPAYDLTVTNAASAEPTLRVMFVIALIGLPFVLLYTAGVYYFFRGKVVLEDDGY
jgi:cytochrome d ubiquinol oxidase subunit II